MAQIEQKLARDEIDRLEAEKKVRSRINVGEQYEQVSKKRFDELAAQKQKEVEERKKIEESLRQATENEAK